MVALTSGSLVADFIAPKLPKIPDPGELIYAPDGITLHPGGHSANVAIILTQLGYTKTHIVGAVGDDTLGTYFNEQLEKHGIVSHLQVVDAPTAKNLALIVQNQDRRFIAELTANTLLTTNHLIDVIKETKPRFFYQGTVGGLKNVDKDLPVILREAKKQGAQVVLDTIPPETNWDHIPPALPYVDILHMNKQEAEDFTKHSNQLKAAKALITEGVKLAVISDGANGLTVATGQASIQMPAFKVTHVDATGAGDALCAGIIKAYSGVNQPIHQLQLDKLYQILMYGQAAGAACVTAPGASTGVTKKNIEYLQRSQGKTILDKTKLGE